MLKKRQSAFVFIDVQGRLAEVVAEKETAYANLEMLIRTCQNNAIPILWTEQIPQKMGSTMLDFSQLLGRNRVIAKTTFSCCGESRFISDLKSTNAKQIVLGGIEAHICVYQTALDLLSMEYEVFVAADAVASRDPKMRDLALEDLRQQGAHILPTEAILYGWIQDATQGSFKDVLNLVKQFKSLKEKYSR